MDLRQREELVVDWAEEGRKWHTRSPGSDAESRKVLELATVEREEQEQQVGGQLE